MDNTIRDRPAEVRHPLGQFYTPPWVCEFIVRWAVRSGDDVVFDPGTGDGCFITAAYRRLLEFGKSHEEAIRQLYAVDVDHAAVEAVVDALSARGLQHNIFHADFFSIPPPGGIVSVVPKVDAVVGNPPYTRWTEIPEKTRQLIKQQLKDVMKKYRLTPQASRRAEPGIYVYWTMHSASFLKEGGRLGMIISNTWLQTDYGIKFANFLLDHYRIKAVIDFSARLFKDALITTCIILAERESNEEKRKENITAFIHIPGEVETVDIDELLKAIETGQSEKYRMRLVRQGDIPRDKKWINLFFETANVYSHPLMVKLGELFEVSRGNTFWSRWALSHGKRPDPGASEFHYLTPSEVKGYKLGNWAYPNAPPNELIYPAVISAKQVQYFVFTEADWNALYRSDEECYMFIGHMPRDQLPKEVEDYVKKGETQIFTKTKAKQLGGRGKKANETEAAKARARERKYFYGWYDLGGVVYTPIFATRYGRYKTRFIYDRFPVALSDNLIALIPRQELDELRIKALLAYLNSSFVQHYIETSGGVVSSGPIDLTVNTARKMPILDVRRL
ncbi:MAG: class I SAM-dependent DNA methyltransferase, partial [Pyrobaculum sp.]